MLRRLQRLLRRPLSTTWRGGTRGAGRQHTGSILGTICETFALSRLWRGSVVRDGPTFDVPRVRRSGQRDHQRDAVLVPDHLRVVACTREVFGHEDVARA